MTNTNYDKFPINPILKCVAENSYRDEYRIKAIFRNWKALVLQRLDAAVDGFLDIDDRFFIASALRYATGEAWALDDIIAGLPGAEIRIPGPADNYVLSMIYCF
jgi:hypothetical protein